MSDPSGAPLADATSQPNTTVVTLSAESYTSQRLKHASPEHLHLTTRRFFIGPIPEGWLNSHRKAWYKRRLALSNFSSREATFDAAEHRRTRSATLDLRHPSLAARVAVSFPQPTDAYSPPSTARESTHGSGENDDTEEDTDEDVETRNVAPVPTHDAAQALGISETDDVDEPEILPIPADIGMDGASEGSRPEPQKRSSQRAESWKTAQESLSRAQIQGATSTHDPAIKEEHVEETNDVRPSTSIATGDQSHMQADEMRTSPDELDTSSKTALIDNDSYAARVPSVQTDRATATGDQSALANRVMTHEAPAPLRTPKSPKPWRQKAPGVRFKVAEGVADRKRRLDRRAGDARDKVSSKVSRRATLREGTVVKMERMLVRVDVTMSQVPDDFDENESMKTETKPVEKWREFMVVARKSNNQEEDDFRLQLYKTRVIPEIENESTKKKPSREVKLLRHSTHVNLYSSLDKTVVVWHPYRKGFRMIIMKPCSTAHSVEWYTFLRAALGLPRPDSLQVHVPDLEVTLHVEKPFERLEAASADATDEATFLAKAAEIEQAVAGRIITKSMAMLERDPEWSDVLKKWSETEQMGLAWKRYDRLEWVYGVNEQKMFGTLAMQQTHDLELRPKRHYPTQAFGKKGVLHDEPAPIEGFLIRLTSQTGLHKRFGKAYFKRLYFSSQDRFLFFNRPAKASPPHPPRLATISGTNVPSSHEIVQKSPTMFAVEPFELADGEIKWLQAGRENNLPRCDAEAAEEARRNTSNLVESDGYIDMCRVLKVRKMKWGASEVDETLDSGSEIDFHIEVDNTTSEDGTVQEIDDDRTFELVLDNKLVIRLQAYDKETRDEWIKRLRKLVKYWKLRQAADISNLKAVRRSNLTTLNIDEDMEAVMGQFARKWEVSRSEASPELYNMCRLTSCRAITMAGMLYCKPKRHSTFKRCSVLLTGGQMLVYQDALRNRTGAQVSHIHHEKQQVYDLKGCYVYSGLIVEDDLLYQNRTFDANQPGMLATTPRVYIEDGWTAADVDVMTCFVVWMNVKKGWFRSVATSAGSDQDDIANERRSKLQRVAQLGVPGRGMVFKCRSRAERDLWVTSVAAEIEAAVEQEYCQKHKEGESDFGDARLEQ